ncbi:hypothetical protein MP228_004297 [Amoeboaphelidium protococcarum]|nr:hypothetical protein MP228_004297 [Amoeboaphelidium protococcarum]
MDSSDFKDQKDFYLAPPSPAPSNISTPGLRLREGVVAMSLSDDAVDQVAETEMEQMLVEDPDDNVSAPGGSQQTLVKSEPRASVHIPLQLSQTTADHPAVVQFTINDRDTRLFKILKIDPQQFSREIYAADEVALQTFLDDAPSIANEHKYVASYMIDDGVRVSCVNWKGRWFISGTDIVRVLLHRYTLYTGRKPFNMKKFEEGIFSDLRRLTPPKDCVLENTRSDFLVFLFDHDCVRSKKKQKVFFWSSFKNCVDSLFCDALERELARIEMAKAVSMSIDEFIKSGVVPTGSSAQTDVHRRPLPFDWTLLAEQREDVDDNGGPLLKPLFSVDQIHYIRNDITGLFTRHLRARLVDRHDQISSDVVQLAKQLMQSKSFKGEPVPQPSPVKKSPSTAAPKKPRKTEVQGLYDDTDSDNDGGSVIRAPISRRARAVQKPKAFSSSPPVSPRATPKPNAQSRYSTQSAAATSPNAKSLPATSPLVKHSPISRSSTPVNMRFTPYGYRRSPFPFPPRLPILDRSGSGGYESYMGGNRMENDTGFLSETSGDEEQEEMGSQHSYLLSASASQHSSSSLMYDEDVDRRISPRRSELFVEDSSLRALANRTYPLGHGNVNNTDNNNTSNQKPQNEFEAAYILLGMNQN